MRLSLSLAVLCGPQVGDLAGLDGPVIVDDDMLLAVRSAAERDAAARALHAALGPRLDPRALRQRAAAAFAAASAGSKGRVRAEENGLGKCFRALGAEVSERFLAGVVQAFAGQPEEGASVEEFQEMVFVIYASRD